MIGNDITVSCFLSQILYLWIVPRNVIGSGVLVLCLEALIDYISRSDGFLKNWTGNIAQWPKCLPGK